jgi:NhaA family Na+:H+ antiporter
VLNLFARFDLSSIATSNSISIAIARIIGKVIGITFTTWLLIKVTKLALPEGLRIQEVIGVGLLAGMGMTVSLVIAEITISSEATMNEIRSGLFISAIISGALGVLWLKRFPVAQ